MSPSLLVILARFAAMPAAFVTPVAAFVEISASWTIFVEVKLEISTSLLVISAAFVETEASSALVSPRDTIAAAFVDISAAKVPVLILLPEGFRRYAFIRSGTSALLVSISKRRLPNDKSSKDDITL